MARRPRLPATWRCMISRARTASPDTTASAISMCSSRTRLRSFSESFWFCRPIWRYLSALSHKPSSIPISRGLCEALYTARWNLRVPSWRPDRQRREAASDASVPLGYPRCRPVSGSQQQGWRKARGRRREVPPSSFLTDRCQLTDQCQDGSGSDHLACSGGDAGENAAAVGRDAGLHLHRFQDHDRITFGHLAARLNEPL